MALKSLYTSVKGTCKIEVLRESHLKIIFSDQDTTWLTKTGSTCNSVTATAREEIRTPTSAMSRFLSTMEFQLWSTFWTQSTARSRGHNAKLEDRCRADKPSPDLYVSVWLCLNVQNPLWPTADCTAATNSAVNLIYGILAIVSRTIYLLKYTSVTSPDWSQLRTYTWVTAVTGDVIYGQRSSMAAKHISKFVFDYS